MSAQERTPFAARFGAPAKVNTALGALARGAKAVAGSEAKVRIFLGDAEGGLASALSESSAGLRKAAAARNLAATETKPLRIRLNEASEVAILPLSSRGELCGVMEVIAPPDAIADGLKALKAVADQGALTLRALQETSLVQRQADGWRDLSRLAHSLVRTRSAGKAVDELARVCHEMFELPVIAWAVDVDLTRLNLRAEHGLSRGAAERIRAELRSVRRPQARGPHTTARLRNSITDVTGLDAVTLIEGGDALVAIGGRSPAITSAVRFIQPMLKDALRRLAVLAQADLQHERLDLGISWTAHELRGPLTGTRAVIDLLLQTADDESRTQHLLKRSREDLDRMAALVDGALRVTMTDEALAQQPTPLMRVLQDAVNMCRAERPQTPIVVHNEPNLVIQADPPHLTGALANVLRNSLWHSPSSASVEIDFVPRGSSIQIRITDQGPRVSGADKEMIFDPFGRGESPRAVGRGKGLGLFIARRVIESHGGTIKVGSSSSGAMFMIDLPVAEERSRASAS